jgi:DNA-binding SARP family transcriptional activator
VTPGTDLRLCLLGGFRLLGDRGEIPVRPSGERLLAFLALKPGSTREAVAWRLWLDHSEEHALACLRSTLWRLPKPDEQALVTTVGGYLRLSPRIATDLDAQRVRAREPSLDGPVVADLRLDELTHDLLPGWYDEWLVVERERHRQVRLHALEAIAERLLGEGRLAEAIEAGLCAVDSEPLRESAHRCVVRAHLAEGNIGEALRQAAEYLRFLGEAGIPERLSGDMEALLAPSRPAGAQTLLAPSIATSAGQGT